MKNFRLLTDDELDEIRGGIDWSSYGKCLIDNDAEKIPELAEIVQYVIAKENFKVATASIAILSKGNPLVLKCYNDNK
ncbi:MAG: hypothetical protein Q4E33_03390 [Erysipelotrichaceae bacterium]|nr:hypothetical protein [Erysipelotrichaceae bacterium]